MSRMLEESLEAPERVAEQLAALAGLARQHYEWASSSPVAAAL